MTTTNMQMTAKMDNETLNRALLLLAARLEENGAPEIEIVICGGSALVLTGMVPRTTKDVDVVALLHNGKLINPAPLPEHLVMGVKEVAEDLGIDEKWLNNGPSSGEGGLFQMGLPDGFAMRLHTRKYGIKLKAHFADRLDQIYFKLYAAADRGGYHIQDLNALFPTDEDLENAARWCMTHDVSPGFVMVLKNLLKDLGYENVADRI